MIDRAVRLAQATSSTTSAALLVAFNLVPLAGVLLWGWNVATILVLYWVENGIIGVLNIPKILLASGPSEPPTRTLDVRGIGPVVVPRSAGTAALLPRSGRTISPRRQSGPSSSAPGSIRRSSRT